MNGLFWDVLEKALEANIKCSQSDEIIMILKITRLLFCIKDYLSIKKIAFIDRTYNQNL